MADRTGIGMAVGHRPDDGMRDSGGMRAVRPGKAAAFAALAGIGGGGQAAWPHGAPDAGNARAAGLSAQPDPQAALGDAGRVMLLRGGASAGQGASAGCPASDGGARAAARHAIPVVSGVCGKGIARGLRGWLVAGAALAMLGGCAPGTGGIAWPLASSGGEAAPAAAPRPAPDQRGVISFPSFQMVVARVGETASSIGQRLGIDGGRLARHNAVDPDARLGQGAVLALPGGPGGSVQVVDPFAGQGVRPYDIPGGGAAAPAATPVPAATAAPVAGADPRQHQVQAGETAWSIARKYGVSVADLAAWNGLPANMAIRTGQRLAIPVAGAAPGAQTVSAPGVGSATPRPPSAATALPDEATTPPAARQSPAGPDLGATRTAASSRGHFTMPASGSIARAYKKGSNEGIDIKTDPGSTVKAAAGGIVAAITRDTNGVPIVIIRHQGELMTVYTGIEALSVSKGDTVTAGQAIGKARGNGVVHFEVRQGFDSVDPADYL